MNAKQIERPHSGSSTKYLKLWLAAESEFYGRIGLRSSLKTIKAIRAELKLREWDSMRRRAK